MRIALDAMGGDYAPKNTIEGAVLALKEYPYIEKLFLVGDAVATGNELKRLDFKDARIEIFHASEVVSMKESAAKAVRHKKDASICRAVDLVKNGSVGKIWFSLILSRKTAWLSISHASSRKIAAGWPRKERSIRRNRYRRIGKPYFGPRFISSSTSKTVNASRPNVSSSASNNRPFEPSSVYSCSSSRIVLSCTVEQKSVKLVCFR
jgi:hypothetical protein